MNAHTKAASRKAFRVLVLAGGEILAEEEIFCPNEAAAFLRAEELASAVAAEKRIETGAYVLDHEQVYLGAINEKIFDAQMV